jgi:hypothetical protein
MSSPFAVAAFYVSTLDILLLFLAAVCTAIIPIAVVVTVVFVTHKTRPSIPPDYVCRLEDENQSSGSRRATFSGRPAPVRPGRSVSTAWTVRRAVGRVGTTCP